MAAIFKQPTSLNKCFLVHDALQVCSKFTWQPIEAEVSFKGSIGRMGSFTFILQRRLGSVSGAWTVVSLGITNLTEVVQAIELIPAVLI